MNIEIHSVDSKFFEEFMKALERFHKDSEIELFGKIWSIGTLEMYPPFEVDVSLIFIRDVPLKEKIVYRTELIPCDLLHYPQYPAYPITPFTGDPTGYPPIITCNVTDVDVTRGASDCSGIMFKCASTDINPTACAPSFTYSFNEPRCK